MVFFGGQNDTPDGKSNGLATEPGCAETRRWQSGSYGKANSLLLTGQGSKAVMDTHSIKVIAVTGGKGGVGKSNIAINLGLGLSELGRRVVLLDGDLGLSSLDTLLGLASSQDISKIIKGNLSLRDILVDGPGNMKVVSAPSGSRKMASLDVRQHAALVHAFDEIKNDIDVLVVDTAPGISDMVLRLVTASREVLLVVTNEPASIVDAYAMIKVLREDYGVSSFNLVVNMVKTRQEGREIHSRLWNIVDRFLDVNIRFAGCIPDDDALRKAVQRQKAVVQAYPRSKASMAFKSMASKIDGWPLPMTPRGNLEFFLESLVQGSVSA